MLTVYSIETYNTNELDHQRFLVATVPTVYGIETLQLIQQLSCFLLVAIALTVYGMRRRV